MTDETEPTLTVQTSGVKITVTDADTAKAAVPFVEGVLEHYLDEIEPDTEQRYNDQDDSSSKTRSRRNKQRQHTPVDVVCNKCGYDWEYRGLDPNGTTCPQCHKRTRVDADTEDRR